MLRANLDGYHDPSRDLWRAVESRTEVALLRGQEKADNALSSIADLREFQARVRRVVERGIGGPLPQAVSGAAGSNFFLTDIIELENDSRYRIEKVLLTTDAGTQIPLNIYVPASPGPHPAVLFLSGHDPLAKASPAYQEACALYAAAGYLVASFDPLGQGERHSFLESNPPIAPGTTEHTYAGIPYWWAGISIARYFLTDAVAVLNHLLTRTDVDAARIIATGSSGGGMLTTLLMALEPRLAGAAPATYVTSRREYLTTGARQDAEQILLGAGAVGLDHDWLLMAMAPKPVCVLAAEWDFFPIEGTETVVTRARRAWEVLGDRADLQLVKVPAPHTYHRDLALGAIRFFSKRLGVAVPEGLEDIRPQLHAPQRLQVTTTGQVARDNPQAIFAPEFLQREIGDRQRQAVTAAGAERTDVAAARTWLRERVTAHRDPVAANVRFLSAADEWHALWRNEKNMWGAGVLYGAPERPVQHIVVLDQGSNDLENVYIPRPEPEAGSTLVLDVRGRGALRPHDRDQLDPVDQASSTYRILTDLLTLDDSLAAAQVWDVLRAIDVLGADKVRLTGYGFGAYLARLAAFCDERVEALTLFDEYVNPDDYWIHREWDTGRGAWHGLIPGLIHHAPWDLICAHTRPLIN